MKENRLASGSEHVAYKSTARVYFVELLTDGVLAAAGIMGAALLVGAEFSPVSMHRSAGTVSATSAVVSVAREKSQEIR